MKWPLDAAAAVRRRGALRPQDSADVDQDHSTGAQGPVLSTGTLGAATLNGPPYEWSFITNPKSESTSELEKIGLGSSTSTKLQTLSRFKPLVVLQNSFMALDRLRFFPILKQLVKARILLFVYTTLRSAQVA